MVFIIKSLEVVETKLTTCKSLEFPASNFICQFSNELDRQNETTLGNVAPQNVVDIDPFRCYPSFDSQLKSRQHNVQHSGSPVNLKIILINEPEYMKTFAFGRGQRIH